MNTENNNFRKKLITKNDTKKFKNLVDRNKSQFSLFFPSVILNSEIFVNNSSHGNENNLCYILGLYDFDNNLIGIYGSGFIDRNNNSADLMYMLDKEYQGRGIMYHAIKNYVNWCFESCELNKLETKISVKNTKSIRLIENLNFVYDGRSRDDLLINDLYYDQLNYSLLKNEYYS